jgi:outer membrane protein assembly factor BamB
MQIKLGANSLIGFDKTCNNKALFRQNSDKDLSMIIYSKIIKNLTKTNSISTPASPTHDVAGSARKTANWRGWRSVILLVMTCQMGISYAGFAQENWPRFRGAQADGVAQDDTRLPETWGASENVKWLTDIPGLGWSSPVVWQGKVFLSAVVGEEENERPRKGLYLGEGVRTPAKGMHHWMVYCLDLKTGAMLWKHEAHTGRPQVPRHPKSTYAAETATTDGERLYVLFGDLGLYCYDFKGKLLWQRSIAAKKTARDYGAAASPVTHAGQVFVVYDNLEDSWIAAFDGETGQMRWRQARDETHSWATPFIWQNELRTEIVVPGQKRNRSYSLAGELLWEFNGRMSILVIPSPFAAHGLCYIASGYVGDAHRPTFAVRPGASGDITPADSKSYADSPYIVWYQGKSAPYNTSQIVYGDYLYTLYDQGFLTCHHAKTGDQIYGKQRFTPRGSFTSSPWAYNGYLFCLSEDGLTYVVKAGPEFKIVATNKLDELCLATPAIANGSLLVRTVSKLYCLTGGARAKDATQEKKAENIELP